MVAKIISRNEVKVSPWVRLVDKEVEFSPGQRVEVYHSVSQPDYIGILARTRSGLIPIVQQYRPAVESYTWELPAGLLEQGESLEDACRRELKEETGLDAESITYLGSYFADTGRLENRLHAFFVRASDPDPTFTPELNISLEFVNAQTLREYVFSGKFPNQPHLGIFALAAFMGIGWDLQSVS